jgi:hypothetical protein
MLSFEEPISIPISIPYRHFTATSLPQFHIFHETELLMTCLALISCTSSYVVVIVEIVSGASGG